MKRIHTWPELFQIRRKHAKMSAGVQPGGGGIFNSYRVKYSPETHQMLKILMDEVKLTTMQRQQLKESMSKGEPLPTIKRRARPSFVDENLFDLKRNYYFLKRTKDRIEHSGAYDREKFRPVERIVDIEKEKERLGSIMTYGKAPAQKKEKPKKTEKPAPSYDPEDRLDELIIEIKERLNFLQEMENVGQAQRYETIIKQEIAAKLREMRKIDKSCAGKFEDVLKFPTKPKTSVDVVLRWEE